MVTVLAHSCLFFCPCGEAFSWQRGEGKRQFYWFWWKKFPMGSEFEAVVASFTSMRVCYCWSPIPCQVMKQRYNINYIMQMCSKLSCNKMRLLGRKRCMQRKGWQYIPQTRHVPYHPQQQLRSASIRQKRRLCGQRLNHLATLGHRLGDVPSTAKLLLPVYCWAVEHQSVIGVSRRFEAVIFFDVDIVSWTNSNNIPY